MPGQVGAWQESESSSRPRVTQQQTQTTGYMATSQSNRTKMADSKTFFGWTTIDGIRFPYLMREDKKFVAVRMVEMKLLSKYPSTYPDELKNRPPLMSHYVTDREIKLLNEINAKHCAGEYGNYEFSSQDLIVKLQDFEEFYNIVKRHFPDEVLKALPQKSRTEGGWVQVNNTVVPFVFRNDFRFVPLSVIRYAAQLLVDVDIQGHVPTDDECKYFNNICKTAGLNFKFGKSTKLVMLNMVQTASTIPVIITELPKDDPFGAAEFKGEEQEVTRLPTQIAPESTPSPTVSIPSGIPSTMGPGMPGLPPGMVSPTSMMPGFPPSATPYWMNPHMGIFPGFGPGSGAGPVTNPFAMQQNHKGQISPHSEVNNNGATKDFQERPSSRGNNSRGTPTSIGRRSSTGTPSPTGSGMFGPPPLRPGTPSAAAGAPPAAGIGMPPPGLLAGHGFMAGNRMMFPMLPNQSPSDYQKLLQMVQMQHQPMRSQGPKGPPPLVSADPYSTSRRRSTDAPPNVTVSRTSSIPKQGSRPRGRPPIISADEPKVKPQHSSRPITTAMANEPPAHQLNPRVPIKRLDFEGKSMACLVKEGSCFALMEALSRVFFPYVPMDEFRYAVEMVLNVPVLTLTDEEELAFIQFYGLPTSKLKCKKAIKLVDFSQYLPQLRYMYKEKADAAGFVGNGVSPPKGSSMPPNFLPPRFNLGNNARGTKSSPPKSLSGATTSDGGGQTNVATNALKSLIENKNKRAADPPSIQSAPPNKKAKKRLDGLVNRLWSKNQGGGTSASATLSKRNESETDTLSEPSASPAAQTPMEAEEPLDQGAESSEDPFEADEFHQGQVTVILPTDVGSEDGSFQGEEKMEAADECNFNTDGIIPEENNVGCNNVDNIISDIPVEETAHNNGTSATTEEQTGKLDDNYPEAEATFDSGTTTEILVPEEENTDNTDDQPSTENIVDAIESKIIPEENDSEEEENKINSEDDSKIISNLENSKETSPISEDESTENMNEEEKKAKDMKEQSVDQLESAPEPTGASAESDADYKNNEEASSNNNGVEAQEQVEETVNGIDVSANVDPEVKSMDTNMETDGHDRICEKTDDGDQVQNEPTENSTETSDVCVTTKVSDQRVEMPADQNKNPESDSEAKDQVQDNDACVTTVESSVNVEKGESSIADISDEKGDKIEKLDEILPGNIGADANVVKALLLPDENTDQNMEVMEDTAITANETDESKEQTKDEVVTKLEDIKVAEAEEEVNESREVGEAADQKSTAEQADKAIDANIAKDATAVDDENVTAPLGEPVEMKRVEEVDENTMKAVEETPENVTAPLGEPMEMERVKEVDENTVKAVEEISENVTAPLGEPMEMERVKEVDENTVKAVEENPENVTAPLSEPVEMERVEEVDENTMKAVEENPENVTAPLGEPVEMERVKEVDENTIKAVEENPETKTEEPTAMSDDNSAAPMDNVCQTDTDETKTSEAMDTEEVDKAEKRDTRESTENMAKKDEEAPAETEKAISDIAIEKEDTVSQEKSEEMVSETSGEGEGATINDDDSTESENSDPKTELSKVASQEKVEEVANDGVVSSQKKQR